MLAMKKWFKNNQLTIFGAVLGAIIGIVYWDRVGCESGTCAITSKPANSTIYFAILGAMVFNLFKKQQLKENAEQ